MYCLPSIKQIGVSGSSSQFFSSCSILPTCTTYIYRCAHTYETKISSVLGMIAAPGSYGEVFVSVVRRFALRHNLPVFAPPPLVSHFLRNHGWGADKLGIHLGPKNFKAVKSAKNRNCFLGLRELGSNLAQESVSINMILAPATDEVLCVLLQLSFS